MSTEERRVFPIETALDVISNKKSSEAIDFMSYAVQREVCDFAMPAVAPIVKGWLFSLEPKFMKSVYPPATGYDGWVEEHKKNIGDNISLEPIPEAERADIIAVLKEIEELQEKLKAKTEESEETSAKLKEAEPFIGKAEKLGAEKTKLEEENAALKKDLKDLKKQAAGFEGKIAINENEIEKSVKDMVAKAVKDALASLPAGAAVGAAADSSGAEAAPAEEDSGPAAEFGFGSSGSDTGGFGF